VRRLLAIVVLLAACGAPADEIAAPPTEVAATSAAESSPASGTGVPAALDWQVDRLGGGQIDGGDLAGRDVVLWFWAPW
jgi:hypothetical protein